MTDVQTSDEQVELPEEILAVVRAMARLHAKVDHDALAREHLVSIGEPPEALNSWQQTLIYFFRAGDSDLVKIGRSDDWMARMKELQTGSSVELIPILILKARHQLEATLHKRFASDRIFGEWFRLSPAILEYIDKNRYCLHSVDI